jgi:hypothetical protein
MGDLRGMKVADQGAARHKRGHDEVAEKRSNERPEL